MTKAVQGKSWTLNTWSDGSKRSYPEPENAAPAWVSEAIAAGWSVGQWAAISGSSPSFGLAATNVPRDVKTVNQADPEFDGITNNWSGGAFAPDMGSFGAYIIGPGGGHASYAGNDVFAFDLDTRTWSELRAESTGSLDATFGEYADGSPSSYHTYFQPAATPALPGFAQGLLILPKSVNSTEGATISVATPYPHYLDLANPSNGWVRLDAIPDNSTRSSWKEGVAGIWNAANERYVLWALSNPQQSNVLAELNPLAAAGSQWTTRYPANTNAGHGWFQNGTDQVLFIDTVRDIIVTFDFNDLDGIKYLKLADLTEYYLDGTTGWPITENGTGPTKVQGGGCDWSPTRQAGIWWGGATTAQVYEFKYASGSIGSQGVEGDLTYAWSSLLDAGNTITPATQGANDNAIYNRFRIVNFPGVAEIALAMTDVDGPVYAFRLN